MADRLISAETFHEKLEEVMHDRKKSGMPWNQLAVAHVVANDCPTVDAQPVVHGEWINVRRFHDDCYKADCSNCLETTIMDCGTREQTTNTAATATQRWMEVTPMTDKEAIEALKLINLDRVHPFYSWEEMLEVRNLAISALQDRVTFCKRAPAGPITNADHIRAMSDEELVLFIDDLTCNCIDCRNNDGRNPDCPINKKSCRYCGPVDIRDWLQQPYGVTPMHELKLCPFCGDIPNVALMGDEDLGHWSILCGCGISVSGPLFDADDGDDPEAEMQKLIEQWNRRIPNG